MRKITFLLRGSVLIRYFEKASKLFDSHLASRKVWEKMISKHLSDILTLELFNVGCTEQLSELNFTDWPILVSVKLIEEHYWTGVLLYELLQFIEANPHNFLSHLILTSFFLPIFFLIDDGSYFIHQNLDFKSFNCFISMAELLEHLVRIKIIKGFDMNQRDDSKVFQTTNLISVDGLEIIEELLKGNAGRVEELFKFGNKKYTGLW